MPGSQPVRVQGGQQVVQQSVVTQQELPSVSQEITMLASDSGAVNETAFRLHLANQYGVPFEAISLQRTREEQLLAEWEDAIEEEGEQRRQLVTHRIRTLQSASSVRLTYTVRIDPTVSGATNTSTLASSLQATAADIAASLSAALGLNVTTAAPPAASTFFVNASQTIFVRADCPLGERDPKVHPRVRWTPKFTFVPALAASADLSTPHPPPQ